MTDIDDLCAAIDAEEREHERALTEDDRRRALNAAAEALAEPTPPREP